MIPAVNGALKKSEIIPIPALLGHGIVSSLKK
jgi:hypothetical protein